MEKTIEIQLAEQRQKFISDIENSYNNYPDRDELERGINIGLARAVCVIKGFVVIPLIKATK